MKTTQEATNQELISGINVCLIAQSTIGSSEDKKEWVDAANEMKLELDNRGISIEKMKDGADKGLYRQI